jgi:DNA polymerase III sliding clamp (beta) subunit (PCNA family)
MNKVEEDNRISNAVNYVEVEGDTLLELLSGVSLNASKDKSLIACNAVEVESEGGIFTARATDRYRLIEGTISNATGKIDKSVISLDDTKRVITLIKDSKNSKVIFSRIGDTITITVSGNTITLNIVNCNYPPFKDILDKGEGEPTAITGIAINPAFMADYAKIAGKGNAVKLYFNGENKLIRVRITNDRINWKALLMPMRYQD